MLLSLITLIATQSPKKGEQWELQKVQAQSMPISVPVPEHLMKIIDQGSASPYGQWNLYKYGSTSQLVFCQDDDRGVSCVKLSE
jgi:hypothetical protein